MRKGFTLIELMIVIAIIAIIAAIAIPSLLESRITANEANASTSLKSGLFPAQTQFQAGGAIDVDADGRGIFAAHVSYLAGNTGAGNTLIIAPLKAHSLMDPKFNNSAASVANPAVVTPTNCARVSAYDFGIDLDIANEDNAESFWAAIAAPAKTDGSEARRGFAITTTGTIFQTKGTVTQATTTMALLQFGAAQSMFATDPISSNPLPNTTNATPFQK